MPVRCIIVDEATGFVFNVTEANLPFNFGTGYVGIAHPTGVIGDYYDLVNDILYPKPGQYYYFDILVPGWVFDNTTFTTDLITEIRAYRREKSNEADPVVRTFDEGGPNEEELGIRPDDDSITAVLKKAKKSEWEMSAETVMFRFESFTSKGSTDIGNRIVTIGFLQEFYGEMDDVNQSYRDAEEYVLQYHASNPFSSIEDAKTHFDTYMSSL